MASLVIKGLTKYYADTLILDNLSFQINPGEKVALIGHNGTGKTTLLKILAGGLPPDEGQIIKASATRIHYLDQQPQFPVNCNLFEAVSEVFAPLKAMELELRTLEHQMASPEGSSDKVMHKYAVLTEEFERQGGYEYESKVRSVLFGVGFKQESLTQCTDTLSGGQRVRAALAKALLEEPEVLLLDEPTNHLDLEAVEWLEGFMPNYRGSIFLVSHDRHFLDKVVTRCIELDRHTITEYTGNFSKYRALKAERMAQNEARYEWEQAELKRMSQWISKFKAGTRSTLAKSMEKKRARIATKAVARPSQRQSLKLNVVEKKRSGRDVLLLDSVQVGYNEQMLFTPFSAEVKRGERVALLGANGSGKTSLLRALVGSLPHRGEIKWSNTVQIGYFDQQLKFLRPGERVIDEIMAFAGLTENEARAYLARFLFQGELVWQSISTLSGGEKNRLNMAKLLLAGYNVLILDEPTNHLDIESREALETALEYYSGTILFVSHDRYFLNKLATRLWHFSSGAITDHKANYSNWRQTVLTGRTDSPTRQGKVRDSAQSTKSPDLTTLENEISRLEAEKTEQEGQMAQKDFFKNNDRAKGFVVRYNRVCSKLKELYAQWERLAE